MKKKRGWPKGKKRGKRGKRKWGPEQVLNSLGNYAKNLNKHSINIPLSTGALTIKFTPK